MNPAEIAAAFDLGRPVGPLEPVQTSEFQTWRVTTTAGRFLIKQLGGAAVTELDQAMQLERRAIAAGILTPKPIAPRKPAVGWAAKVPDLIRVYEWVDHRTLTPQDDVSEWFGRTLSTLHGLLAMEDGFVPEWRWLGVYPRARWESWIASAAGKPWASLLGRRLDHLTGFTERVRRAHAYRHVLSHRDVGPWNVHVADDYLLIDWEGAGPVLPGCETGRSIRYLGRDDFQTMVRLRDAYLGSGGRISCAPEDFLLDSLTDLLAQITERIRLTVGDYPDPEVPLWMDPPTADERITSDLERFPVEEQRLSELGVRLLS
ncbi:MAG TPA: phosphotransferase [Mycobacteriales bacterium]|nr:phosphotransferase [Mycobacteriales bacterium]